MHKYRKLVGTIQKNKMFLFFWMVRKHWGCGEKQVRWGKTWETCHLFKTTELMRDSGKATEFHDKVNWQYRTMKERGRKKSVEMKSITASEGGRKRKVSFQPASHHRALHHQPLLHENIISSSPCGSLRHNQRWLNWILRCLLEHDYTPKDPQLNITQMNSHFHTITANWTQHHASQIKALFGPVKTLQVYISFKRGSQEPSVHSCCLR